MGKQKGETGRIKNRPSSSSLAASLLPAGASSIGFGGYLGSSRVESSSPADDSVPFADVDSEVAQHLKRLGRKDPTTKLKALASLCLLFKQKPGEEIVQIIPQWAFEYKRLLHDYNREVRRATHETMMSLVVAVRRGLAPHLKSLMGPWWLSQFDPIPEVSQAARRSLEAAFPAPERRLDALMLCMSEIFIYLDENLKLTPQVMSDKATPTDELEDMHQRVISSSLLAVATLIDVVLGMLTTHDSENVTTEQKPASKARMTIISSAENMFTSHKYFLEFLKSKNPSVRSATYSVLTSFIKHAPHACNEGNIKILSAAILGAFQEKDASCHSSMWDLILLFSRKFPDGWSNCNVQKVFLNRFWHFLKNGCYGSQQISYPALVLFLESIPSKAVGGEQFILNFFQNLWSGRNSQHSSAADSTAFFKAYKECFLWAIYNVSRYCTSEDATGHLSLKIINDILVMLLWHDYLQMASPKKQGERSFVKSDGSTEGVQSAKEIPIGTTSTSHSKSYVQELGKCVVGILSDFSLKDCNLLGAFCSSFQKDCLMIFQQGESSEKFELQLERIETFFRLLDQLAWQNGQTWPVHCLARPMVVCSFPVIKSLDSPHAVRLLSVLVEIFGAVTMFSSLHVSGKVESGINNPDEDEVTKKNQFLQAFTDDYVPWCLHGHCNSSNSKLDFLIALIQDEYFSEQWCAIITEATKVETCSEIDPGIPNIEVLTMFFEKVRKYIGSRKLGITHYNGSLPEHWQHELLDSAAVYVACHRRPSSVSCAQFLRALLGGSVEDDRACFLSRESVILIFEEFLRSFASLISTSSYNWAKTSSSLLSGGSKNLIQDSSSRCKFEMAQFALDVLEGSIFCLNMLDVECALVPGILSSLFIIDWVGSSMAPQVAKSESCEREADADISISEPINSVNDELEELFDAKMILGRRMHTFLSKISSSFWRGLGSSCLSRLRDILIQTIRLAVFESNDVISYGTSLCSDWVLNLLEITCRDSTELQSFLDQLCEEDSWSLWVAPCSHNGTRSATLLEESISIGMEVPRHQSFVAFVDKLISRLGFSTVIAGSVPQTPLPSATVSCDLVPCSSSYSRVWLAAEVLCSWRWQEGSALDSFLPSLSKYAQTEGSDPAENVVLSLAFILLNGALVHEDIPQWVSFNAWAPSADELDSIEDPFLRALVSLLFTLIVKDNSWKKCEALSLLEYIVDKLFIGTTLDRKCLRVLPYVLSIIIQPLLLRSSELDEADNSVSFSLLEDNFLHKNILSWLQTALSFPSLGLEQTRQHELEEWIQVVLSCYPLNVTVVMGKFQIETRVISHSEKILLLSLFRKQQFDEHGGSSSSDQMSYASSSSSGSIFSTSTQIILSKLAAVSVGYCWHEFAEEDWDVVLGKLSRWLDSSVLLMEGIAENIDDTLMNCTAMVDSEFVERIDLSVNDSSPLSIASSVLIISCIFSHLDVIQGVEDVETVQSIRSGKWAQVEDAIMEKSLRLLFTTGVAEAIASSYSEDASSLVASSRLAHSQFWRLVALAVIKSPQHVRKASVESMELWGLSKGAIDALYAVLFSPTPISSLQIAAYNLLSKDPICGFSLFKESCIKGDNSDSQEYGLLLNVETSEESFCLRDEISCLLQKPTSEILEMDLLAQDRINIFLVWALLLSYLHSLPSSSTRERLIQYIQDSVSSTILDCIFQHIPLKLPTNNQRRKESELSVEASKAASAAKHAIATCSLSSCIESLWPVGTEQMASLAGSIYGMMIHLLPFYVRNWFTSLRDRSLSSAIESFTKAWCSPHLLSDELSQVRKTIIADENFSVNVNRSAYEIVATYKKEETGMDLVIRLPSCYPLRPVDVECTRSLGISEVKQRKWLLSLTAFIRNQNGAIAEAICIWKSNFDKEFEGIEECPICYSIIHTSNHGLPRLACKTCKHKFHSACLYKWFSTSHKSTCPLCQTPF